MKDLNVLMTFVDLRSILRSTPSQIILRLRVLIDLGSGIQLSLTDFLVEFFLLKELLNAGVVT